MPRIDPSRLDDLAEILEEVRGWDGVEDRSGGTFYLRHRPFLHFHAGRDTRRADVRGADGWTQVDLPEPAPPGPRRQLRRALVTAYAEASGRQPGA